MNTLFDSIGPTPPAGLSTVFLSLLMSFLLGTTIATVYRWTHSGPSYSRPLLHTQVLACLLAAIMIIAIGNNLARGLGILGTMALIRFRTPIRDPRDIIFIFAAMVIGIACGAQLYGLAIIGTIFFGAIALMLTWSPFTSRREFEGLLRFLTPHDAAISSRLQELFSIHTSSAELIAIREATQGEFKEYSYQVRLVEPSARSDLVDALNAQDEISEASLVMQRSTVEI